MMSIREVGRLAVGGFGSQGFGSRLWDGLLSWWFGSIASRRMRRVRGRKCSRVGQVKESWNVITCTYIIWMEGSNGFEHRTPLAAHAQVL